MTTYDDEIYSYLTRPDNYRASKQIASQLIMVEERMMIEFWQEVKDKATTQLDPLGWKVDLEAGKWLSIHRPNWKHLGINCEKLHALPEFGIHYHPDFYDKARIEELLAETVIWKTMTDSWRTWAAFRYMKEYDFRQQQLLDRILPEHRKDVVKSLVLVFSEFVDKYQGLLARIHNETGKS